MSRSVTYPPFDLSSTGGRLRDNSGAKPGLARLRMAVLERTYVFDPNFAKLGYKDLHSDNISPLKEYEENTAVRASTANQFRYMVSLKKHFTEAYQGFSRTFSRNFWYPRERVVSDFVIHCDTSANHPKLFFAIQQGLNTTEIANRTLSITGLGQDRGTPMEQLYDTELERQPKGHGQNFTVGPAFIDLIKMLKSLNFGNIDTVVDVGSGTGRLQKAILQCAKKAITFFAFDVDADVLASNAVLMTLSKEFNRFQHKLMLYQQSAQDPHIRMGAQLAICQPVFGKGWQNTFREMIFEAVECVLLNNGGTVIILAPDTWVQLAEDSVRAKAGFVVEQRIDTTILTRPDSNPNFAMNGVWLQFKIHNPNQMDQVAQRNASYGNQHWPKHEDIDSPLVYAGIPRESFPGTQPSNAAAVPRGQAAQVKESRPPLSRPQAIHNDGGHPPVNLHQRQPQGGNPLPAGSFSSNFKAKLIRMQQLIAQSELGQPAANPVNQQIRPSLSLHSMFQQNVDVDQQRSSLFLRQEQPQEAVVRAQQPEPQQPRHHQVFSGSDLFENMPLQNLDPNQNRGADQILNEQQNQSTQKIRELENRNREMSVSISAKDNIIDQLKHKKDDLERQLHEVTDQRNQLSVDVQRHQQANEQNQQQLLNLRNSEHQLRNEHQQLSDSLAQTNEQKYISDSQLAEANQQVQQLQRELAQSHSLSNHLEQQLRLFHNQAEQNQRHVEQLNAQLAHLTDQHSNLQIQQRPQTQEVTTMTEQEVSQINSAFQGQPEPYQFVILPQHPSQDQNPVVLDQAPGIQALPEPEDADMDSGGPELQDILKCLEVFVTSKDSELSLEYLNCTLAESIGYGWKHNLPQLRTQLNAVVNFFSEGNGCNQEYLKKQALQVIFDILQPLVQEDFKQVRQLVDSTDEDVEPLFLFYWERIWCYKIFQDQHQSLVGSVKKLEIPIDLSNNYLQLQGKLPPPDFYSCPDKKPAYIDSKGQLQAGSPKAFWNESISDFLKPPAYSRRCLIPLPNSVLQKFKEYVQDQPYFPRLVGAMHPLFKESACMNWFQSLISRVRSSTGDQDTLVFLVASFYCSLVELIRDNPHHELWPDFCSIEISADHSQQWSLGQICWFLIPRIWRNYSNWLERHHQNSPSFLMAQLFIAINEFQQEESTIQSFNHKRRSPPSQDRAARTGCSINNGGPQDSDSSSDPQKTVKVDLGTTSNQNKPIKVPRSPSITSTESQGSDTSSIRRGIKKKNSCSNIGQPNNCLPRESHLDLSSRRKNHH